MRNLLIIYKYIYVCAFGLKILQVIQVDKLYWTGEVCVTHILK